MSNDSFTETTHTGWFERLGQSCLSMILGLILFLSSFYVLFWNEGRTDFSQVTQTAVEISINEPSSASVGKLVAVTGPVTTTQKLGDGAWLKPDYYIAAKRVAEMYAWQQKTQSDTQKNLGGSTTKTTNYQYTKTWQEEPENSKLFRSPQGHENPPMPLKSAIFRVPEAKIGVYSLNPNSVELPELIPLILNAENTQPSQGFSLVDNYMFKGRGSLSAPEVGDIRLSYSMLENQANVTLFGKLETPTRIGSFLSGKETLYRLIRGDRASSITKMKQEHETLTWVFRGVGFLLMWSGLALQFHLLTTLLDVLPFLGNIVEGLTGAATFMVALILSSITILVSSLLHNVVALFIAIGVGIVVIFVLRRRKN